MIPLGFPMMPLGGPMTPLGGPMTPLGGPTRLLDGSMMPLGVLVICAKHVCEHVCDHWVGEHERDLMTACL